MRNGARKTKVLVLAPPLQAVGGIQNYVRTLFAALQNVLGEDGVRIVAVPGEPHQRNDGSSALRPFVKLRFLASALAAAISWTPDLIICAHIGVAPAGCIIQKLTRIPYWVVLYGIEVWGELSPAKRKALRATQRLVSITRFTLNVTIATAFPPQSACPNPSSDPAKGENAPSRDSSHRLQTMVNRRWSSPLVVWPHPNVIRDTM